MAAFASLVGVTGRPGVLDRLLLALRVEAAGDALEQAVAALQGRRALIVLDNAEQLAQSATELIATLAEALPQVHWLVTSRRPLGLDGEQVVALDALPQPPLEAALEEVAQNPAVRLYVDRARAHRADFAVSAGNRGALAALVRWLEGLPLALELAASHSRTLGPAELLSLLREARERPAEPAASLAFLARRGTRSGSDPRHASMLAVMDWSWQLLSPALQHLLGRISHLSAGATLHAAAALALRSEAAGPRPNLARAQAELDELVAHSVLRIGAGQDGQMRYTPYEPVREYALAMQDEAAQRAGRAAVLAWLQRWGEQLPPTPPLASVRDELPNVMQALGHAPADGHAAAAVTLVLTLQPAWGEIALPTGVLEVLSNLLATPGLPDALAAGGHALAGLACQEAGQAAAARRHLQAALARPLADEAMQANVLSRAARLRWRLDRDAAGARELIERALPLARSAGRPNIEAALLSLQASILTVADGEHERAREMAAQALVLWRASGNRHLINAGRFNVAVNAQRAGRSADVLLELRSLAEEGRALADWDLACGALDALGTALQALRRWPQAARAAQESLAVAWDASQRLGVVYALWNIAPALARLGAGELAARTMGAAQAQWEQRFGVLDAGDRRDLRRVRRFARVLLGAKAAAHAWRRGAEGGIAQAVQAVLDWPPPPASTAETP
jgi:predicted ATPase